MIRATSERAAGEGFLRPLLVAGESHRDLILSEFEESELGGMILEPAGRNTAPAIALAARHAVNTLGDPLMLVMPSDQLVRNIDAFHEAVQAGARAAEAGWLVTFGIAPDRPETGYGYIEAGRALDDAPGVSVAAAFHEKPDRTRAEDYLRRGGFSWNAGIFLMRASAYLGALKISDAGIHDAAEAAMARAASEGVLIRPDRDSFLRSPSQSIDYAVMEKADNKAVVPVDMGWSDIGAFDALQTVLPQDEDSNAIQGDAYVEDCADCLVWAENQFVGAVGVEGLVIVATGDAVAVLPKSRAQDVKALVEHLKSASRTELTESAPPKG